MLACARIGAIHSVVFGGFAAAELAQRIDARGAEAGADGLVRHRARPRGGLQAAARRRDRAGQRTRPRTAWSCSARRRAAPLAAGRDLDWREAVAARRPRRCVPVPAHGDPLYILYTSGTTGMPKGVVRDHGGHAVALAWSLRNVYGMQPGEVFWAASDIGWVVGHSYIVYAPLLLGCTTVALRGQAGRHAGRRRVLARDRSSTA